MIKQRKIFITGAAGSIGSSLVQEFLQAGHFVAAGDITSINSHDNDKVPERLLPLQFDIRDINNCNQVIQAALEKFGSIDTLINVAGICYGGDPLTASPSEWEDTFDINVKGMFQITQAALPHLQKKERSDIVNISSVWGVDYNPNLLSYSASKFAVEGYTGGLREWGLSRNIRVTSLQVDKVDTNFRRNLGSAGEFPNEKLKKMLTPEDVSQAVEFVLNTNSTAHIPYIRLDAPLWYQS
ncbi:SDR family oxidoreductase [Xenorhabdus sp. Vera]|uniref:SDR family oxidoreductase n=1 Tax=Xenorhabdus koppenhoeferi TaxID=351659 RepID=UPI0019B18BA9|nr:SDR family oxidoreductase [Xenorhabdus sp. Vera]MBD2810151.1 SDR family oxidoreductase [Xenorhabdus sp. Vera]